MIRVEIRCCCEPGRLLGFVTVDRDRIYEGLTLSFVLRAVASLKPYWLQRDGDLFELTPTEKLQLSVSRLSGIDLRTGELLNGRLAIKSNDTPIKQLRRIAGFEEAQ
jgi:hypothetical protein